MIKLVASSCFLTVNVAIAHELGLDSAVMLGELASTQVYWEERGAVDENGMFYETAEQIEEKTTLSPYKQAKAIKELEARGLIKTKMKGVPAKKYFLVDGEELGRLLESKFPKNLKTSIQKTLNQDTKKLEGNNKRESKKREVRIEDNNTVLNSELSEAVKLKVLDYLEYRKEMGKPFKSERGVQTLVHTLEKQEQVRGAYGVIECINRTMTNGWQGLFWDKQDTGKDRYAQQIDDVDNWGRGIAEQNYNG